MSYVVINIPDLQMQQSQQQSQYRNSTRSFKTALSRTNTANTTTSFATAKSYNRYNAHVVNTNNPRWLNEEGVNTSYNMNVEARKRWLAKQPFSGYKKRSKTRKYRKRY